MEGGRIAPAAQDLLVVTQSLWPVPARSQLVHERRTADTDVQLLREFVFVPNAAHPRLLIPGRAPAAAAAALRRYSHALTPIERIGRSVASAVLRTGLADRLPTDRLKITQHQDLPPAPSIEGMLAELLGEPVVVSLGLGNRRANQKPVLQVLRPDGRSLAFVKVGDSPVSRDLVRAEARALARVAELSLQRVRVPEVLSTTTWNGLELLVLSALPTTARRRRPRRETPLPAMDELSRAGGVQTVALSESEFWRSLHAELDLVYDEDVATRLRGALDTVEDRYGGSRLDYGSWHGDWTAWNMSWEPGGLQLWDWERFEPLVPLGFDALHYRLRIDIAQYGEAQRAGERLRCHGPALLTQLGVPAHHAELTISLYLLKLCLRFSRASQGVVGQPLLPRARWLLGFICADPAFGTGDRCSP